MDKEPWRASIPPDSKYYTGMDFPRQGSFNAVDDYLDMDDALQNYILSLNDTSLPTGGLANEAAGHLNTLPTASKQLGSAVPQSQNGSAQGMGGPMAANPTAGLTAQPLYVQEDVGKGEGNTSPTGMANVAGAGPFVFTTPGEPGYGGRSTSESGSGGSGSNPARQRKRREVVDPDNEGGSAEKKQQVMQEKNRLAQRRFRERQKVMPAFGRKLACLLNSAVIAGLLDSVARYFEWVSATGPRPCRNWGCRHSGKGLCGTGKEQVEVPCS